MKKFKAKEYDARRRDSCNGTGGDNTDREGFCWECARGGVSQIQFTFFLQTLCFLSHPSLTGAHLKIRFRGGFHPVSNPMVSSYDRSTTDSPGHSTPSA